MTEAAKPPANRWSTATGIAIVAWMALVISVFFLTKVSPEGVFARMLPSAFWDLHSVVYSFFYRPSVYE